MGRPDSQLTPYDQVGSNLLGRLARAWLTANGEVSIRLELIASAILLDCLTRGAAYVVDERNQILLLPDGKSGIPEVQQGELLWRLRFTRESLVDPLNHVSWNLTLQPKRQKIGLLRGSGEAEVRAGGQG